MGVTVKDARNLQAALDLVSDQDNVDMPLRDLVLAATDRVRCSRELRAVVVDLLEFMGREQVGSEGWFYEIERRAALIRGLIPSDWMSQVHERQQPPYPVLSRQTLEGWCGGCRGMELVTKYSDEMCYCAKCAARLTSSV